MRNWRKFLAVPVAALLLFATACNEAAPSEYSRPDDWVDPQSSSTTEPSQFKKFGDTISYSESEYQNDGSTLKTKLEITVTGAQVYENFADAGIPVEETSGGSWAKLQGEAYEPPETPFVLVDVTIHETEGPTERKSREDGLNMTMFSLHSKQQLEWCEENGIGAVMREPRYFSGHGEVEEDGKGYEYFWLEPGEEQEYQVGFFLVDLKDFADGKNFHPEELVSSPEEGLLMRVGSYYVDLETGGE